MTGAVALRSDEAGWAGEPAPDWTDDDEARAFGGVARVYGAQGLARLRQGHVVVVGVGGVGSWCVEALARSAVGWLTLIDLDHVAESNLNRQIQALRSTVGAAKTELLARRIADISPRTRVSCVDEFIDPANAADLLPSSADVVIDATDQPSAKAAMVAVCHQRGQAVLVCGAAGGRTDPLALHWVDLARSRGDALLASVRSRLRRHHGFARGEGANFGVPALASRESRPVGMDGVSSGSAAAGAPLACAGYGSLVSVTATMGMAAAQQAIERIVRG